MAMLNVTFQGRSGSVKVGNTITAMDARRIAVELLRTGSLPGVPRYADMTADALDSFVLDTHHGGGETTFYLRPKVPFGQG